ncbi:MAG: hypothetical protein Fur0034_11390 [Desulfuromonadia bacterium]
MPMTAVMNFFEHPPKGGAELLETIISRPGVVVERIVSRGEHTPWLEQEWDEWVMLVDGGARLCLDGVEFRLGPGDHLFVPAGKRHRVVWTDPDRMTYWLAVHFRDKGVVSSRRFELWRQDDNGNHFLVERFSDNKSALDRMNAIDHSAHRQIYRIEEIITFRLAT